MVITPKAVARLLRQIATVARRKTNRTTRG
jgi:hypothetical protein